MGVPTIGVRIFGFSSWSRPPSAKVSLPDESSSNMTVWFLLRRGERASRRSWKRAECSVDAIDTLSLAATPTSEQPRKAEAAIRIEEEDKKGETQPSTALQTSMAIEALDPTCLKWFDALLKRRLDVAHHDGLPD